MISQKTILSSLPKVLKTVDLSSEFGKKYAGKVRDFWIVGDKRITVTTDRQSAFDVILGHVPFKGTVLNQLAAFWFEKTKKIVPNHMISTPDPNVLISKNCTPIPVEMIVRGYMSGVTKTSIWYSYQKGERTIYGVKFPGGMKKNEKLPNYVITPTTHPEAGSDLHDERLTRDQIIKKKIVPEKLYKQMEEVSLKLFDFGSKWCKKQGLILVDTKYEFGLYDGKLRLIDEIHTPDSARFWIAKTYKERMKKGLEPENFDKEFLRLWYAARGYTGDGAPPKMTKEFIAEVARRYISVYEKITGKKFKSFKYPIDARIHKSIARSIPLNQNGSEVCKRTRQLAASTFVIAYKKLTKSPKPISELQLRDVWLAELRKSKTIFPDGWYTPPPHGMSVLFATDSDPSRVSPDSLRDKRYWPKNDIFLDRKHGLIMIYASPVDRESGIIGDFGLTIYLGKDLKLRNHLRKTYQSNVKVFKAIQIGMSLSELNKKTTEILTRSGLRSNLLSASDPTGTNYGHTIPGIEEPWTDDELSVLRKGNKNWKVLAALISKKRKFVNIKDSTKLKNNMAVTIEPRPNSTKNSDVPAVYFHTIATIDETGAKELLTNFDEVFTITGMEYVNQP